MGFIEKREIGVDMTIERLVKAVRRAHERAVQAESGMWRATYAGEREMHRSIGKSAERQFEKALERLREAKDAL